MKTKTSTTTSRDGSSDAVKSGGRVEGKRRHRGSFFRVGGLQRSFTQQLKAKVKSSTVNNIASRKISPVEEQEQEPEQEQAKEETPRAVLKCDICNVVFDTERKMQTHLKYSTLHELNLKSGKKLLVSETIEVDDEDNENATLVYRGCKFIVRHAIQLDLYIYEQPANTSRQYKRLAVICYNIDNEAEYPAIYLNGDLVEMYAKEKTKSDCNHAREVNVVTTVGEEAAYNKKYKQDVGAYVMSRIQYNNPGFSVIKNSKDEYDTLLVRGPKNYWGSLLNTADGKEAFEKAELKLAQDHQALIAAATTAQQLVDEAHTTLDTYTKTYYGKSGRTMSGKLALMSSSFAAPLKRFGSKLFGAMTPRRNMDSSVLETNDRIMSTKPTMVH